jgi:hypothetical protein
MNLNSNSLKVAEKRLVVLAQALDADWFNGRRHRRLNLFDGWSADLWIHETGHAVIFSNRKIALTEILINSDFQIPENRVIWQRVPLHEDFATIQPGGSIEYQLNYELETADPSIFRYLSQELQLKSSSDDLVWQPDPRNRMQQSPIVKVHIESGPQYLSVQTYHTFPQELAILRTQSLFELQTA